MRETKDETLLEASKAYLEPTESVHNQVGANFDDGEDRENSKESSDDEEGEEQITEREDTEEVLNE